MRIFIILCVMLTPIWSTGGVTDRSVAIAKAPWTHERVVRTIVHEARRTGVDPALAVSIAEIESSLNPTVASRWEAHLKTYSVGLFQVLHATARKEFNFHGSVEQLRDPSINIKFGMKYISKCNESLKSASLKAMACCYQAGFAADPGFCERHVGVRNYLHKLVITVAKWRDEFDDATSEEI